MQRQGAQPPGLPEGLDLRPNGCFAVRKRFVLPAIWDAWVEPQVVAHGVGNSIRIHRHDVELFTAGLVHPHRQLRRRYIGDPGHVQRGLPQLRLGAALPATLLAFVEEKGVAPVCALGLPVYRALAQDLVHLLVVDLIELDTILRLGELLCQGELRLGRAAHIGLFHVDLLTVDALENRPLDSFSRHMRRARGLQAAGCLGASAVKDLPLAPLPMIEEAHLRLQAHKHGPVIVKLVLLDVVTIELCARTTRNVQDVLPLQTLGDLLVFCKSPLHKFLHLQLSITTGIRRREDLVDLLFAKVSANAGVQL
mmetsp:Transcript_59687/g.142361  ORF Transcript_59687/g.142361 Transcript_59687/m.142361 type:complete len:309 (-) Transcript_59687:116-1042(-)